MQQVNFYRHLTRDVEQPCSALQSVWLAGFAAMLMVFTYLGLLVAGGGIEQELANISKQKQQLESQVQKLEERKQAELQDEELAQRLLWLEGEVAFRRQLLSSVNPSSSKAGAGFAEHLHGLGRQTIDGMWFTGIELTDSGSELVLTGATLEPEYVPRYLQKLSREAVFSGHRFQVLRMTVPEGKRGGLSFEVRSRPEGSES